MKPRTLLVLPVFAALFLSVAGSASGAAAAYPSKPIRIIVPLTPGGSTDSLARLIGERLQVSLGQPVTIENRPGGNTVIGMETVARATPDGYTLLISSNTQVILPQLMPSTSFQGLLPVATVGRSRYVLCVHPSVAAATLKELIALAKARPGELNYGSSGAASGSRIAGELVNMLAGVRIQNIPYRGGSQALVDAIGGHVQISYNTPTVAAPYVTSGRLKALAVSGKNRVALLPNVPTFDEAGLPGFDLDPWQGILAPPGTPKAVIDKLSAEIAKILAAPQTVEALAKLDVEPFISTPAQFAAMLQTETAKVAKIIKAGNIKLEE